MLQSYPEANPAHDYNSADNRLRRIHDAARCSRCWTIPGASPLFFLFFSVSRIIARRLLSLGNGSSSFVILNRNIALVCSDLHASIHVGHLEFRPRVGYGFDSDVTSMGCESP